MAAAATRSASHAVTVPITGWSSPNATAPTASPLSRHRASTATTTSGRSCERPLTGNFRGAADRLFMAGSSPPTSTLLCRVREMHQPLGARGPTPRRDPLLSVAFRKGGHPKSRKLTLTPSRPSRCVVRTASQLLCRWRPRLIHGQVTPAGCVKRVRFMLPVPYPTTELKSTLPWLQSVKVNVSVPQGLVTIWFGSKFGIQRPPVGG